MDYYNISEYATAFTTTRHGGVSHGPYGEFNINAYCGDDPRCIEQNLEIISHELGITKSDIIMPHQTHGCEIRQIGDDFASLPPATRALILEGVDALTTEVKDICIGVSTADCIPIIIYDPEHHAAATIHAGWRGTVKRIAQKAVSAMQQSYGSQTELLRAVIGPGISLDAFAVGDEVYEEFAAAKFDMQAISVRKDKWHIDLKECNRTQLIQAGLTPKLIYTSNICTYNNPDDYFSARRLGAKSGRLFTGIVLRSKNNKPTM